MGNEELFFNEYRVLVSVDENFLEMDSGDVTYCVNALNETELWA